MRARILLIAALGVAAPAGAQAPAAHAPAALTPEDYGRAERLLAASTGALVTGLAVQPMWLPDGRFWYRNTIAGGAEFVLVDPARRRRGRAFDHERLAAGLSAAADTAVEPLAMPFRTFELAADGTVRFDAWGRHFACPPPALACTEEVKPDPPGRTIVVSPDGRLGAFVRAHDLWVVELASGRETRLTTDGIEDFGYATNNAGWTKNDRPVVVWSPDSRRIATFRHDARGVGEMYLATTRVGHPELEA